MHGRAARDMQWRNHVRSCQNETGRVGRLVSMVDNRGQLKTLGLSITVPLGAVRSEAS